MSLLCFVGCFFLLILRTSGDLFDLQPYYFKAFWGCFFFLKDGVDLKKQAVDPNWLCFQKCFFSVFILIVVFFCGF